MRHVNVKVLPDGSGRVRIHWLIRDDAGPAQTPGGVIALTTLGPWQPGGVRGRVACAPKQKDVTPSTQGRQTTLFPHSDDPRAVTCPDCCATQDYKDAMAELGEAEQNQGPLPEDKVQAPGQKVQAPQQTQDKPQPQPPKK